MSGFFAKTKKKDQMIRIVNTHSVLFDSFGKSSKIGRNTFAFSCAE